MSSEKRSRTNRSKPKEPEFQDREKQLAYEAGLREGEKRLARALKRYITERTKAGIELTLVRVLKDWLASRSKKGR